jgi:hypothetical protein
MTEHVVVGDRTLAEWAELTRKNIKPAIEGTITSIASLIFGENLEWSVSYTATGKIVAGAELYDVTARTQKYPDRPYCVSARIPISPPDTQVVSYRVADRVIRVVANDWAGHCSFTAWSEYNPYNTQMTIVRTIFSENHERWMIFESFEGEVLFRCQRDELPQWARDIINDKWSADVQKVA